MMRLLVLDLDGTLFDTTTRWQKCQELYQNKRDFWGCFQSPRYMDLDTPKENVINFVKSVIDNDTIIIIVSGRSEKQLDKTSEQLKGIGITPHEIYVRGEKDFRKDYQFKNYIISQLMSKYKADEVIMIDDSDDVINHISSQFQNIRVIDAKKL